MEPVNHRREWIIVMVVLCWLFLQMAATIWLAEQIRPWLPDTGHPPASGTTELGSYTPAPTGAGPVIATRRAHAQSRSPAVTDMPVRTPVGASPCSVPSAAGGNNAGATTPGDG